MLDFKHPFTVAEKASALEMIGPPSALNAIYRILGSGF